MPVRRGDFVVPESELDRAEAVFEERPPRNRALDRAFRSPITTDIETYENVNGRGLDFPGVDTPTDSPRQDVFDAPGPRDFGQLGEGDGATVTADPQREGVDEAAAASLDALGASARSLSDALFGNDR